MNVLFPCLLGDILLYLKFREWPTLKLSSSYRNLLVTSLCFKVRALMNLILLWIIHEWWLSILRRMITYKLTHRGKGGKPSRNKKTDFQNNDCCQKCLNEWAVVLFYVQYLTVAQSLYKAWIKNCNYNDYVPLRIFL